MMVRLGAVPGGGVIDVSAVDFADGSQRFNWCACQPAQHGMGSIQAPDLAPSSMPPVPIFDFSFWNSELGGGGANTLTPANSISSMFSVERGGASLLDTSLGKVAIAAIALGGLWLYNKRNSR
jgi:hypothetical protein